MMYFLADIGGTKTRFALASRLNRFNKVSIYSSVLNYSDFLNLVKNFTEENSKSLKQIKKIVFGFAGMLDKKKEKLIFSPNLKDFEHKNLKKDLEKILGGKIILENDAILAGLGEGKFGSGKTLENFGYITLSTGVGGAKITNNDLRQFSFSEPGHSFLLIDNFLFEIEELLGGKSIRNIFGEKPEEIKNNFKDDINPEEFWNYYQEILSIFLVNVSIFWSVEEIILGGGIVKSLNFKKINFLVKKLNPLPIKIRIIKSKLGELNVIYGGLTIAMS
ncbi:MAG: transcriptional regulator [Candidatus Parcubacteria bacterium]|nr:MAG: transcriptional regulator [Candidatus Parcubacteria bacterium]